jgi:VWFA-related protein
MLPGGCKYVSAFLLSTWTLFIWPVLIWPVFVWPVFVRPVFAGGLPGDDGGGGTYRSSTSEVRVTFFATDGSNHPVNMVTNDDFAIVDGDTIIRHFRSLARSEETALDAVILIDTSESVARRLPATVKEVLRILSQSGSGAGENFSIVSFSGLQPVALCLHNCDTSEAGQRLLSVKASGPTPLFDALAYSVNLLSQWRASAARPVLILFSDGDDTISKVSGFDALDVLMDSGIALYAVDLDNSGKSPGSAVLRRMAEATGGRYFSEQSAATVLQSVLEDLRTSWVVTYELSNTTIGFHPLRILPKHDLELRFHCRGGYYYGGTVP